MTEEKVWLYREHPWLASAGTGFYFRLSLRNFRGEVQMGREKFKIKIDSEAYKDMTSDVNGILEFMHSAENYEEGEGVIIEVIVDGNVTPQNIKEIPLDSTAPIQYLLRFGSSKEGIKPSNNMDPLGYDCFFGNGLTMHPSDGMSSTAQTSNNDSYTSKWRKVSSDTSGFFEVNVKSGTLHYFAFALFSTGREIVDIRVDFEGQMDMFFDSESVFSTRYNSSESETMVPFGWHQVLMKTYCTEENMRMKIHIMCSGGGWFYS
ncbi:hypothetical protein LSM04_004825 [Trypanosoma melophagium]|uniref:uncharacterized protein n=1 Tax=Trypanosoma melophagium TaxID=715481 RepID=UPI003519E534|nr:hypothetical protein LSM04_004825 [Trypanosoma melophagium]